MRPRAPKEDGRRSGSGNVIATAIVTPRRGASSRNRCRKERGRRRRQNQRPGVRMSSSLAARSHGVNRAVRSPAVMNHAARNRAEMSPAAKRGEMSLVGGRSHAERNHAATNRAVKSCVVTNHAAREHAVRSLAERSLAERRFGTKGHAGMLARSRNRSGRRIGAMTTNVAPLPLHRSVPSVAMASGSIPLR